MEIYIQLGLWDVKVEAAQAELLQAIQDLFNYRTATAARDGVRLLKCVVVDDPKAYNELEENTSFDSCSVEVSPVVTAHYALEKGVTKIKIERTAIIELTDEKPYHARVFLKPLLNPEEKIRPLPEAFFYPMMVEWLRNVEAYLVHCGAATLNGKAIILIGPPGSGKSTHVLRMVLRGASFLADDLMLMHPQGDKILLMPFREVANLGEGSVERFSEMAFIQKAPRRGDGKFQVAIHEFFEKQAVVSAEPGAVLHLYPDQDSWIRERPMANALEGIHNMAYYMSRKKESTKNFFLLTDLMQSSLHFDVSQGYLAENLDELMARISDCFSEEV